MRQFSLLVAISMSGFIAGLCTPLARAEPAPVMWIYRLDAPVVEVPAAMAKDAVAVWYGCEVRTEVQAPYGEPWRARNPQSGASGTPQLMSLHRPGMARVGLNYDDDGDRIKWAVMLWSRQGWNPWSCKP